MAENDDEKTPPPPPSAAPTDEERRPATWVGRMLRSLTGSRAAGDEAENDPRRRDAFFDAPVEQSDDDLADDASDDEPTGDIEAAFEAIDDQLLDDELEPDVAEAGATGATPETETPGAEGKKP